MVLRGPRACGLRPRLWLLVQPEAYHLEAYNSGSRLGIFWDPEEPIKIYFLIWIREIINVTRASVEESAAKTLKSR